MEHHDYGEQTVLLPPDSTLTLFTDGLARLFVNPLLPVRLARDLGLLALDLVPGLKRRFTRRAMGLSGHLPRLALGRHFD